MHIYFAGIGGVAIGPLAEIARGAGHDVSGSDPAESLTTRELAAAGIEVFIYPQDGSRLREVHARRPIDWFVYTSALSDDNGELMAAGELGLRVSKRDELLSHIVAEKELKLIAVAGTHGKTTTTGMLVWAFQSLGIPVSYSVGTTLSFGPAGLYDGASRYFIYECDEYDRNFLAFNPALSLVTTVDHDHFDTYPTAADYTDAFRQFAAQSGALITWETLDGVFGHNPRVTYVRQSDPGITLPGDLSRQNATLALEALARTLPVTRERLLEALNTFPGTDRRFEALADGLYTDYGHHPIEIAATLQLAHEVARRVVLVYQPHQNSRQIEIQDDYRPAVFRDADHIYWLPTYLTRETPGQPVLTPEGLTRALPPEKVTHAALDDALWESVRRERDNGALVLFMGAGPIDAWVRERAGLLRPDHR